MHIKIIAVKASEWLNLLFLSINLPISVTLKKITALTTDVLNPVNAAKPHINKTTQTERRGTNLNKKVIII